MDQGRVINTPLFQPGPQISSCQNIRIGEENVSGVKSNEYGDAGYSAWTEAGPRSWERNPPLEAKDVPMRWRTAPAPLKMTELMMTMKVAIILIKWDEMWRQEMVFSSELRCAISQTLHLAVSAPHQCPSSNIYKRPAWRNTDRSPALYLGPISKTILRVWAPFFPRSIFPSERSYVPAQKDLTFLRLFVCVGPFAKSFSISICSERPLVGFT